MIRITKVDYLNDYKLSLTFSDGKVKVVDLSKYKNKGPDTVFYPFRDIEFFKLVKVDSYTGTIVWPNGVDLCPDSLYEIGEEVPVQKKQAKAPLRSRRLSTGDRAKITSRPAYALSKICSKKAKT